MKKILLLITIVLMTGLFTACGNTEINLNDYVTFEFEGYDTLGIASINFDKEAFVEDYEDVIEVKETNEMIELELAFGVDPIDIFTSYCIDYKTEIGDNLSNGDKVELKWDCNDDMASQYFGCTLVYSDVTKLVDGLKELEYFDAFENVVLDFDGYSPSAYIAAVENTNDEEMYQEIQYRVLEEVDAYSNGDIVTVEAYCNQGWENFANTYGMAPSTETEKFTVEGLPYYVDSFNDIPDFDVVIEDTKKWILENETSVYIDFDEYLEYQIDSCEYLGSYVLSHNGSGDKSYISVDWNRVYLDNVVFLLYKMNVSLPLTDVGTGEEQIFKTEYVLPVYYYNIAIDENSECVLDPNVVSILGPQNYVVDTNIRNNIYWDYLHYEPRFNGYGSEQDFYNSVIADMEQSYQIENNIQ